MQTTLSNLWEVLRTSYWFIPTVMSVAVAAASVGMLWLDQAWDGRIPVDAWYVYGGGADGARAVLTAIVGSMISVTSVVFSITIVALTLAAGQYGSRLLRNFMRDRLNQITLGTFIATFIYALLVLRTIQDAGGREFVPPLSVTLAVLLVIVSIGVLIMFIHHIASSIQADAIIQSVAHDLRDALDRLYPAQLGQAAPESLRHHPAALVPDRFPAGTFRVCADNDDYLQAVNENKLLELARSRDLVVRLRHRPGDFVMEGAVLADVWPVSARSDDLAQDIRNLFVLGKNRTLQQDAEFGVQQLVEIAVRALSPGINDPGTANSCIDRLASALSHLAGREFPQRGRFDAEGQLRVVADTTSFSGFVDTAFHPIRQNASSSPSVLIRLLEAIGEIANHVRTEEQRRSLYEHAALAMDAGEKGFVSQHDIADLRERHAGAMQALRRTAA